MRLAGGLAYVCVGIWQRGGKNRRRRGSRYALMKRTVEYIKIDVCRLIIVFLLMLKGAYKSSGPSCNICILLGYCDFILSI